MVRPPYKEGPGHAFAMDPSQIHVFWTELDYPHDVIHSVACCRLRAHTLRVETWSRLTILPLLVTCATLMTCKMSSMSSFTAPIHAWSLSMCYGLYFTSQVLTMCLLTWARTTISCFSSFMHLLLLMSRLAVALL